MSSVRMCDRCGNIFSERDDDWSTTTGAIQKRRENGTRYSEQVTIDQCGPCTTGAPSSTVPRLPSAITAGTVADEAAAAEQADDHEMLRQLQRQLGDLQARLPGVADGAVIDQAAATAGSGAVTEPALRF